ncbi:MAG: hypothetical protein IJI66_01555 [Erysipelotrichaceae bacterium]|nr:hypothetical protein [Erysipelotrichaceae bacterium]
MKLFIEVVIYCVIFTLVVKLFAGKSPLDCLYFYPEAVQERVCELGLAKREDIAQRRKVFVSIFTSIMAVLLIVIIRYVNGVHDYWIAYLQSLFFLELMNWYDGIVIDKIWVAKDPFWLIEEVKDIPYVQTWKQVLKKRGFLSLVWIIASFIVALIVRVL